MTSAFFNHPDARLLTCHASMLKVVSSVLASKPRWYEHFVRIMLSWIRRDCFCLLLDSQNKKKKNQFSFTTTILLKFYNHMWKVETTVGLEYTFYYLFTVYLHDLLNASALTGFQLAFLSAMLLAVTLRSPVLLLQCVTERPPKLTFKKKLMGTEPGLSKHPVVAFLHTSYKWIPVCYWSEFRGGTLEYYELCSKYWIKRILVEARDRKPHGRGSEGRLSILYVVLRLQLLFYLYITSE